MSITPFASNYPTNWQRSDNGGATWTGPPATNGTQVVGPRGTQRFRQVFDIPPGLNGTFTVTVTGDIWDGSINDPAELLYDGVSQGTVPINGTRTYSLPVVGGNHTLTLLIGSADDNGGITSPIITFDFTGVAGLPCDCCPTGGPRCALVAQRFSTVAETVAQAGWNQQTLAATIDGIAGNGISGYNSPSGTTASTTLRVTYTLAAQHNRVRGLRLWNNGGADLGDNDGLGPFVAEFYSGATLLNTFTTAGANGGAAQTLLLPSDLALDGVDRVVLRSLGKLSASTVAPLWRELQLLELQTVFPCRRTSGTLEWYTSDGVQVPSVDIVPCPEPSALVVDDLTIQGAAFNFNGDGSGADEGMLLSPAAASVSTGTVQVSPGLYHPSAVSPTTPCGGRRMDLTFPPGSSFDFAYTNIAPFNAGGVYIQLAAPSLGGTLNFGPFAVGTFTPGQSRTVSVPGGRAVLTYLGGPTNANAPQSSGATCGLTSSGTSLIALHFGNTSTADFPIRFNIAFTKS